jgi:hypothetical protein
MKMHMSYAAIVATVLSFGCQANAAEIKVLSAGAFKQVVLALVPGFEKQTGHKVSVDNGTAGELKKRIEGGETFDVTIITPAVIDELTAAGKIAAGTKTTLASVGVGVMVKAGARSGQAEGQAQEGRLCRRPDRQRRSRTRHSSDQRDRAGEGSHIGRTFAEGNPEHDDLCRRFESFAEGQGCGGGISKISRGA